MLAALAVATWLAGSVVLATAAEAASLTSATWSVSASTTGATGVSYTYSFTTATASSLSSVSMTVPSGTGGSPTVGAVSPAALAGGTASLGGTTVTYSFTAAPVVAGQAVSIQINGLTNTSTAGGYTSAITTSDGGSPVDTGTSGTVTITTAALGGPAWSVSSTATGATGTSYTYGFSNTLSALTSISATVPPGTSGTPTQGSSSGIVIGSVSLTGTTLTMSVTSVQIGNVSIQINGLTNTATAGSYTSEIVVTPLVGAAESGITPAVTFTGQLALTSPSSLGWSAGLSGSSQSVADQTASDQRFSVDDETNTAAGWRITVSATTFTSGADTLPDSGTLALTGSLTSATATSVPGTACAPSCTPPVTSTTYPVAITTAATSPTPATVFNAEAGSGIGPVIIGGSSAADPVGWWISVPANALVGSYTSTITIAVVSGP